MATTHTDTTPETLELIEDRGAAVFLRRRFVVEGLLNTNTDARTLQEALDESAVPNFNTSPAGFTNLLLTKRTVTAMTASPDIAEVICEYESKAEAGLNYIFRGSSSVQSVQTEKDIGGFPITVQHSYPANDPEFPGETKTQVVPITFQQPQLTLIASAIESTDLPAALAGGWQGYINSLEWFGGGASSWLISRVTFVPHDQSTTPTKWMFTFEFQFNPDFWTPLAFFKDPTTGRPPPNLIFGVGTKLVARYPSRDFNEKWPLIA